MCDVEFFPVESVHIAPEGLVWPLFNWVEVVWVILNFFVCWKIVPRTGREAPRAIRLGPVWKMNEPLKCMSIQTGIEAFAHANLSLVLMYFRRVHPLFVLFYVIIWIIVVIIYFHSVIRESRGHIDQAYILHKGWICEASQIVFVNWGQHSEDPWNYPFELLDSMSQVCLDFFGVDQSGFTFESRWRSNDYGIDDKLFSWLLIY